jgi:hypothetical protein
VVTTNSASPITSLRRRPAEQSLEINSPVASIIKGGRPSNCSERTGTPGLCGQPGPRSRDFPTSCLDGPVRGLDSGKKWSFCRSRRRFDPREYYACMMRVLGSAFRVRARLSFGIAVQRTVLLYSAFVLIAERGLLSIRLKSNLKSSVAMSP